jgi:hypothetical protein
MVSQIDELKSVYSKQVNALEKKLEENSSNGGSKVEELMKKLEAQKEGLKKKVLQLVEAHAKEQIFNNKLNDENQVRKLF